ncbi:MAG TPA: exopolysaccharide biosynthesis protein [Candidatus Megaira endosymbiont of Nemacystus decipiens]|nr:exopolysaccharide biosynthesis protein [Candidatus Megaera endosymbiont of Nemacystus decipiens]
MIEKNKEKKTLDTTTASVILKNIGNKEPKGKTKIAQLMQDFHENGILLAMIFFSLPVAIPLPYPPGFTTLMGLPLIILSYQLLVGSKKVRLPQKINEYEIKNSTLKQISDKIVPIVESVERYVKPRFRFASSVYCEQLVGLICIIASLAVSIPIPFTNAIPALGITVSSLGLLNRDGLVIFYGAIIAAVGTIIALFAIIGSFVFLKSMFSFII